MNFTRNRSYYLALFLISFLAFWQITLYVHPVKYDMADCYFPWRYYIGDCLQHGKFPYWNPYQNLGYPMHADPGSGTWYPLVWFIGYFFGYSLYTIGMELWFHVFLAGVGFFLLARYFKLRPEIAFLAALSYMLCGLFISNAQHLGYVVSACWLPYVLRFYLRMRESGQWKDALRAGFFLFLMITGGYPAFTIVLFYLLLLFFVQRVVVLVREGNTKELRAYVGRNVLFSVVTLLLVCGFLLSLAEVAPYITRTNQFQLKSALFGPFSPQSFISFLLPYASVKAPEWIQTDMSMSNGYVGLLMLIFFIPAIGFRKTPEQKLLFGFGLVSLLAAMGDALPVREFLFHHVPMMNIFRFPSLFRLFSLLAIILLAANWLQHYVDEGSEKEQKFLKGVAVRLVILFLLVLVLTRLNGYVNLKGLLPHVFDSSADTSFVQHAVFQSLFQLLLLAGFLYLLWKINDKQRFLKMVGLLILVDLFFAAQLNTPYTAHYPEFSAKASDAHWQAHGKKGFPALPDKQIAETDPHPMYFGPFWKNVNIFQKEVSAEGFNSFIFAGYENLRDSFPQLQQQMIRNKLAYLTAEVYVDGSMERFKKDSAFKPSSVFLKRNQLQPLQTALMEHHADDRVALVYSSIDTFKVEVQSLSPQLLVLLQSNYKGWHCISKEKELPILTANQLLMAVPVPAGKSEYLFYYRNDSVRHALVISLIAFLLVGGILLVDLFRKKGA